MIYSAAFMLGLVGSMHCVGMCGPIALALPVRTNIWWLKLLKYVSYNLGRVTTYAALGLLIGTIGKGLSFAGLQQTISIFSGIIILLTVLVLHHPLKFLSVNKVMTGLSARLKVLLVSYLKLSSAGALFVLGMINGLLPCGMVYAAVFGALAMSDPLSGSLFMSLFGLGTLPVMLLVAYSGTMLPAKAKVRIQKVVPYMACLMAVLLILRGMNLDIPYVSPAITGGTVHKCH